MAWELNQVQADLVTPELLYDLYRRHKMVPESVPLAIGGFRSMASGGWLSTVSADGTTVAHVVISGVIAGESCDIDLVPVSKYFRGRYESEFREVMRPVLCQAFDTHGVRRISSAVPASRRRTVKALKALGFKIEGVMRDAVQIVDQDPEDLIILGLLATDMED